MEGKVRKNKGFSLIEVLVVLGIIGILSSFITPRVMNYMAEAKDVKVKSTLEALRTASELYYLEEGKPFMDAVGSIKNEDLEKLEEYLSNNLKGIFREGNGIGITMEVGGSRETKDGEALYGGSVTFTTANPNTTGTSDRIKIWVNPSKETNAYTLAGEKWIEL